MANRIMPNFHSAQKYFSAFTLFSPHLPQYLHLSMEFLSGYTGLSCPHFKLAASKETVLSTGLALCCAIRQLLLRMFRLACGLFYLHGLRFSGRT